MTCALKQHDERNSFGKREFGKAVVMQSAMVRRLLPRLEQDWDTARMDQQWRVLQIAVLERCAAQADVDGVLADAAPAFA